MKNEYNDIWELALYGKFDGIDSKPIDEWFKTEYIPTSVIAVAAVNYFIYLHDSYEVNPEDRKINDAISNISFIETKIAEIRGNIMPPVWRFKIMYTIADLSMITQTLINLGFDTPMMHRVRKLLVQHINTGESFVLKRLHACKSDITVLYTADASCNVEPNFITEDRGYVKTINPQNICMIKPLVEDVMNNGILSIYEKNQILTDVLHAKYLDILKGTISNMPEKVLKSWYKYIQKELVEATMQKDNHIYEFGIDLNSIEHLNEYYAQIILENVVKFRKKYTDMIKSFDTVDSVDMIYVMENIDEFYSDMIILYNEMALRFYHGDYPVKLPLVDREVL